MLISHDVEDGLAGGRLGARAARRAPGVLRAGRRGRRRRRAGAVRVRRAVGALAPQGPAARAAHARVGAGDADVQRHDLRALPLRPGPRPRSAGDLAAGVLWVTLLFAAMLGIEPAVRRRARAGRLRRLPARAGRPHRAVRREGGRAARLPRRRSSSSPCRRSRSCCSARRPRRRCRGWSPCSRSPTSASRSSATLVGALARPDPRARPARAAARAAAAHPGGHRRGAARPRRCSPRRARGRCRGAGCSSSRSMMLVFGLIAYAVFDFLLED